MNKFIIFFTLLTIISCTTKEVFIENIPFSYGNNNAQPNLVSSNGTLLLSWISSKNENKASLHFSHVVISCFNIIFVVRKNVKKQS